MQWGCRQKDYRYRPPITHAMGLHANKIITMEALKHPFRMEWASRQTKLKL